MPVHRQTAKTDGRTVVTGPVAELIPTAGIGHIIECIRNIDHCRSWRNHPKPDYQEEKDERYMAYSIQHHPDPFSCADPGKETRDEGRDKKKIKRLAISAKKLNAGDASFGL